MSSAVSGPSWANASASTTDLVEDYAYDYLDPLKTLVGYDTATNAKTDESSYVYGARYRA